MEFQGKSLHWILIFCINAGCMTTTFSVGQEPLMLNNQKISYYANNDSMGFQLCFHGSYTYFSIDVATEDEIIENNITSLVRKYNKSFEIGFEQLSKSPDVNQLFFRIVAVNHDVITSDFSSEHRFFRFLRRGIPVWIIPPMSDVRIPIPSAFHCPRFVFRWPKLIEYNGEHCSCLPYETGIFSFEQCAEDSCRTEYNIMLEGHSVKFQNFNSSDILVHFMCEERPQNSTDFVLETFLASYRLQTQAAGHSKICSEYSDNFTEYNNNDNFSDNFTEYNNNCSDEANYKLWFSIVTPILLIVVVIESIVLFFMLVRNRLKLKFKKADKYVT